MIIHSIQTGQPKVYVEPIGDGSEEQRRRTAIFKTPVSGAIWAGTLGLEGDGQADKRYHGGADKAINAYCFKHYPHWAREFNQPALPLGAFGENLTLDNTDENSVCIGDIFEAGGVQLQLSQPRQPCGTLAWRWKMSDLVQRVEKHGSTGWYFRVLKEGKLQSGAELKLLHRPHPRWTVTAANDVLHHRKGGREAAHELAALPELSEAWQIPLRKR